MDTGNLVDEDLFAELSKVEVEPQPKFISGDNDNTQSENQITIVSTNNSSTGTASTKNKRQTKLSLVSSDTLARMKLPPIKYIIDKLLSSGFHILAGPPKLGKSWLVLWIALMVSCGKSIWGRGTMPGSVLYLALEDSQNRLQSRQNLVLNGQVAPKNLFFATEAMSTTEGLLNAMEDWVDSQMIANGNPQLIIIDTFQKIRGQTSSDNAYANDYRDAGELKKFADKHEIAIVVVHHTRKQGDQDVFNTISGSTGLTGAADSMFVVKKQGHGSDEAIFYATGRDIEEMELAIKFNKLTYTWDLVSSNASKYLQKKKFVSNPVVTSINQLLNDTGGEWRGTASDLYKLLFDGMSETEKTSKGIPKAANVLTRFLNSNKHIFQANDIKYIWDTTKKDASYVHFEQIPPSPPGPPEIEEYQGFEDEFE